MFKNKSIKFISAVFLIAIFLITSGLGCGKGSEESQKLEPVNLVYWRVKEGKDSFVDLINEFNKIYPKITITYKQVNPEIYEQELWENWAKDEGPDIFSIPIAWLGKYQDIILPCPLGAEIKIKKQIIVGTLKKTPKIITKTEKIYDLVDLRKIFIDTVSEDVVINKNIYGLPLSMDILALYYNRDLLNNSNIARAPVTWQEFTENVKALTLQNREENFIQSGASLGGIENTRYLTDILSLLMLQNGTIMATHGKAMFNQPSLEDKSYFPGKEALRFYTDFSNPSKEVYAWNEAMPDSLESFINNKTAFFFGYSSDMPIIQNKAPKLNFAVAQVPQISESFKKINFVNYWIETVSKRTKHSNEAWVFLNYISQSQNAKMFVNKMNYPTAHRDLIAEQLRDVNLAPFTEGVLTAKIWYRGKNYPLVKEAFKEMVKNVITGVKVPQEAVDWATQRVNLTY